MVGNDPAPHQHKQPRLQVAWWQRPHRFEAVQEDADEERYLPAKDGLASSSETQSLDSGSNEEASWNTATPDHVEEELDSDLSAGSQKRARNSSTAPLTEAFQIQRLLAENALLKRQLSEALDFRVPSAEANAAAAEAVADELRTQNRKLLKTLKDLQESTAALLKRQTEMHHIFEENAALQKSLEETRSHTMLLVEDIKDLEIQLSEQRQKCADSEAEQDVRKQLCYKLFMAMHGEDVRFDKRPRVAAEEKGFQFSKHNNINTVSEPFYDGAFEDAVAHGLALQDSGFLPSAECGLYSAAHKCDGKPTIASPGGSSAQDHTGSSQTCSRSSFGHWSANERKAGPHALAHEDRVTVPITFGRQPRL